jgi:hypothetical protein
MTAVHPRVQTIPRREKRTRLEIQARTTIFALPHSRRRVAMAAIANSPRLQMMTAPATRSPADWLNDPKTQVRVMSLNEAQKLSQFSIVMVLMPAHADGEDTWSHVKALESSGKTAPQSVRFTFGDVEVDFATMEANRGGVPIVLTALEFKTLKYLIQNARRVISRDELLTEVWGYNSYPSTRTVDNKIATLRKKLEREPARPVHFQTMHGAGYRFMP